MENDRRNEGVQGEQRKAIFQFRINSVLWLIFSIAAFVAGMQFQKHMVSVEFSKSSPIAIVGSFDLDGDGVDDASKLLQMIMRNGGTVCAYDRGNGDSFGSIDHQTFLVVGNVPDDTDIPILMDAERLGTYQKTIQELLAHLGMRVAKQPRNIHDGNLSP